MKSKCDVFVIHIFQLNATDNDQITRLLEHVARGPPSRFHGFLRACVMCDQQHIVPLLKLEPKDYVDYQYHVESQPQASPKKIHYFVRQEDDEKLQIGNDLLIGMCYNKEITFQYERI